MNPLISQLLGLFLALGMAALGLWLLAQLAKAGMQAWTRYRLRRAERVTIESQIQQQARHCITHAASAAEATRQGWPYRAAAERRQASRCSSTAFTLAQSLREVSIDPRVRRVVESSVVSTVCIAIGLLLVAGVVIVAFIRDPLLGLSGTWLGFAWVADYLPENGGAQR